MIASPKNDWNSTGTAINTYSSMRHPTCKDWNGVAFGLFQNKQTIPRSIRCEGMYIIAMLASIILFMVLT